MKTRNMFLVLSTLTIIGCSGASPDANDADEQPSAAATTQSTPAQASDAVERDHATFTLPPGSLGASQPSGTTGGAGPSGGTTASTHRHDLE